MFRVIIVEDEPALARGLAKLIEQRYEDFKIISICRNGNEGFTEIIKERPDLIFVDINMPVLSGLSMLKKLQSNNLVTHSIILTGHAEFDYAKTAVSLGVNEYLLKPILLTALDETIKNFRSQYKKSLKEQIHIYLQNLIYGKFAIETNENLTSPLSEYNCTFIITFTGSFFGNVYNEEFFEGRNHSLTQKQIKQLTVNENIMIIPLQGRRSNEVLYALIASKEEHVDIETISIKIYNILKIANETIHLVISDTIKNGSGLSAHLKEAHIFALSNIKFGRNECIKYKISEDKSIQISTEIIQLCSCLPSSVSIDTLTTLVHSAIKFWRDNNVTQLQLLTDLRHFLMSLPSNKSRNGFDVEEMISFCPSYSKLEKELLDEVRLLFNMDSHGDYNNCATLIVQVKNWLDSNYTKPITYKIFKDIFGYNEKYISIRFKEEYGISPSQYICELRLAMAKKLLKENPNILLKDVAECTGFSDAFYFSRVFKLHEGVSPSQYRN